MIRFALLLLWGVTVVRTGLKISTDAKEDCEDVPYNSTYPITPPIKIGETWKYRIAIISDRDKLSKVNNETKWTCRIKKGWLTVKRKGTEMVVKEIKWDETVETLVYDLNQKGRAMEMSDLKVFNGKLYTCDDKTGMVYELVEGEKKPIPFVHLNDGNGHEPKSFKCEWMTVKDELLYVGSIGVEWVKPDGSIIHKDTFWVKTIDSRGLVRNVDWYDMYDAVRASVGYKFPGYFFNEAVNWSDKKQMWYFLPRKGSKERYDEVLDETRGNNLLLKTADFKRIKHFQVGQLNKTQGFSSFKFIPGSNDNNFLALKTVEVGSSVETWIGAYTIKGKVLLKENMICRDKYEGLEFI